MLPLRLAVLGPLQIVLGAEHVVHFAYHKARALLVYLAVESDQPHHRDALVSLLWPDLPDSAGRTNLRQVLADLRRVLGETEAEVPLFQVTRDTIGVNPLRPPELDLARFTALLDACDRHAHRHPTRCRACAERREEALALYRGDFLVQLSSGGSAAFEEWAQLRREQLHQRAFAALDMLARYYERSGEDERARRCYRRQLQLEPWREDVHVRLMQLLARAGQRSAALRQYQQCREVLAREFGAAPLAETKRLVQDIRDGMLLAGHGRREQHPPSWPSPLTPLIGRAAELAQIDDLLGNPSARIISIVGPGGVGKTRIALAAAERQAPLFADGVAFVALAQVSSETSVASAIADALGLSRYGSSDPKAEILRYVQGKELLLVIDNAEHLVAQMGLLSELVAATPPLVLLVTSRVRLALQSEWVVPIHGLPYPVAADTGRALHDTSPTSDAEQLFLEAARRVRGADLHESERPAIADICRHVAGLPLAIELAATWTRTLPCAEIARMLAADVHLLASDHHDLPERHRSVVSVFTYSWRLLSHDQQAVLRRLAVFRGPFTSEAARAVAGATTTALAALCDWSLVSRTAEGYVLHELIRQLAEPMLSADVDDAQRTRSAHAAYFTDRLLQHSRAIRSPQLRQAVVECAADFENIREAVRWLAQRDLPLLSSALPALWHYLDVRGWLAEGHALYALVVDLIRGESSADPQTAYHRALCAGYALAGQGWFLVRQGRHEAGAALLGQGTALIEPFGPTHALGEVMQLSGVGSLLSGRYDPARRLLRRSLQICRGCGNRWFAALALGNLGLFFQATGQYWRAEVLMRAAIARFQAFGDVRMAAAGKSFLSPVVAGRGDLVLAAELLESGVTFSREAGDRWNAANGLASLAELALAGRAYADARRHHEACRRLCQEINDAHALARSLNVMGQVAYAEGNGDEAGRHFTEALRLTVTAELPPVMLDVLVGIGAVTCTQHPSRARRLWALAYHHPASRAETKARAMHLLRAEGEAVWLQANARVHGDVQADALKVAAALARDGLSDATSHDVVCDS